MVLNRAPQEQNGIIDNRALLEEKRDEDRNHHDGWCRGRPLVLDATSSGTGGPQGSCLQTCTDVRVQGDALVATCRTADRREQRSSLAGFKRCIGDIGNNNGVLECNFASGAQGRGT